MIDRNWNFLREQVWAEINKSGRRCDHLFLTVGSNPMPVFVAILVLVPRHIHLITTPGVKMVGERIEKNLIRIFQEESFLHQFNTIFGESEHPEFSKQIELSTAYRASRLSEEVFNELENLQVDASHVGLHYSGGTKAIVYGVTKAFENYYKKAEYNSVKDENLSYLDDKNKKFIFNDNYECDLDGIIPLLLDDIYKLHNYRKKTESKTVFKKAENQESVDEKAILDASNWLFELAKRKTYWNFHIEFDKKVREIPRKSLELININREDFDVFANGLAKKGEPGYLDFSYLFANHFYEITLLTQQKTKDIKLLRKLDLTPLLSKYQDKYNPIIWPGSFSLDLSKYNHKSISKLCKFLHGGWFEEYLYKLLLEIKLKYTKHIEVSKNIFFERPKISLNDKYEEIIKFELDLCVLRGHQTYAISVTTAGIDGQDYHLCKQKAFEVGLRAKQLGGDQAESAIVTFLPTDKTNQLTKDIRNSWLEGKATSVFGLEDVIAWQNKHYDSLFDFLGINQK